MDLETLLTSVIDACYQVHRALAPGYLESVYKHALLHELKMRKIAAVPEVAMKVMYKGEVVGEFRADIVVENSVVLELKAVSQLTVQHEIQLVNYLSCTGIDNGLLVNFGSDRMEIKRKFRHKRP